MSNIVITGASSGIGKEIALQYANEQNNLLLLGRNKERLTEAKNLCEQQGAKIIIKACDIREAEEIKKIISDFDKKHPVTLVIANAGISAGSRGGSEDYQQLKDIFDTNIYGVINSIYPLIEKFKARKAGQIAIISSMAGLKALPSAPAYSCSKVCVKFFGDSLRADLKKYNIKVNIIFPGYIKTPMTEVNEFPMPFLMDADKAAKKIRIGLKKNKAYIIFPKIMYYVIQTTKLLPLRLSDLIFSALPKK